MKLSRHARNAARLYRISPHEAQRIVANPDEVELDKDGNTRAIGQSIAERAFVVIVARDDPNFVITLFPRR